MGTKRRQFKYMRVRTDDVRTEDPAEKKKRPYTKRVKIVYKSPPKANGRGPGGRPKGSRGISTIVSREKMAKRLGLLPHEFLALVASGETIKTRKWQDGGWVEDHWDPTPEQQIDAAKAAAPYYQPRLVSQKIDHGPMMMQLDQAKLSQLPEPMLQALEMLITSLMQNNALPAIEPPKTINGDLNDDDDEFEELFK